VDDDPAILHSTCFLLEGEGHAVETFASGHELLAALPDARPSCVLLDQVMPGLDGLAVIGRIRALAPPVPVILITGHPDPAIRTKARAAGVPLMEKPYAFEALLGLLAAIGTGEPDTACP
jgi:FixJ family two-component response regulator